jgi:hypothetical protein
LQRELSDTQLALEAVLEQRDELLAEIRNLKGIIASEQGKVSNVAKERDELLAALKAIKAMISQPVTDKRDRTQTEQALAFQILSDDCQIARNTIDKAIAKAEGSK